MRICQQAKGLARVEAEGTPVTHSQQTLSPAANGRKPNDSGFSAGHPKPLGPGRERPAMFGTTTLKLLQRTGRPVDRCTGSGTMIRQLELVSRSGVMESIPAHIRRKAKALAASV